MPGRRAPGAGVLKGNAECHTTNKKFRQGYDRIRWTAEDNGAAGYPRAHPGQIHLFDRAEVRYGYPTGRGPDGRVYRYHCTRPGCDVYADSNVAPYRQ